MLKIPFFQQKLINIATDQLSKTIHTEAKIGGVDFSLFNTFNLKDVLIRDEQKDTLLYAGKLSVSLTDWFFTQKQFTVYSFGLENANIQLQRTDSTWNHAFIGKAFASKDTTAGQPSQLMIDIKSLDLKYVHFKIKDRWRGEDQSIQIGRLHLKASEINLAKKRMLIQDVYISEPLYNIFQYTGNRPDSLIPVSDPNTKEHWNKEGWYIEANAIQLEKGMFQLDVDTIGTTLPYFDGEHFQFANINGNLDQVRFAGEKITAALHLSTKERSGFEVSKLHADMQLDPSSMSFKDLSILTPYSRIQNYFAMDYRSFTDDMSEFIHKVNMRGSFRNSIIDLRDIAFFAPELKEMPIKLTANGIVTGTVDDLKSNNISLKWGRNSELKCKIDIKGLPDIESTRYTANNIYINTNPTDFYKIHNQIKSSMGFDLAPFQSMKYVGNASMYGDHLKTKGKLITSIGSAQAEVDIAGLGSDAMNIKTSGDIMQMELGKLFQFNDLRNVNAHFNVASKNGNTIFDTKVHSINYNDYTYSHLDASGNYTSGILTANLDINDPNVDAQLYAGINFKGSSPITTAVFEVNKSNLLPLHFTKNPISLAGKSILNIQGDNLDNISGEGRLEDVVFSKNKRKYIFDSVVIKAEKHQDFRNITLSSNDIEANVKGNFTFEELPSTLGYYFGEFYPFYFKKSLAPKKEQDLMFDLNVKNANYILALTDNGLNGLSNSKIKGRINSASKIFELDAAIPKIAYNKIAVYDLELSARGTADSINTSSKASSVVFNDSLFFPTNTIEIHSSKSYSTIDLTTSSNLAQYGAKLSANIENIQDGVMIYFNPSKVVFNEKTWNIEKGGELLISRSKFDASNFKFVNGEQSIGLMTLPIEANQLQTFILSLNKVNLGELLPIFIKEPRIQGITTGDLTIEDPFNHLKLYLNAQTDKTRFEDDSIGLTSINGFWDNQEKKASFFFESENPLYKLNAKGKLDLKDSLNKTIETDINIQNLQLSVLKPYLGIVFSDMSGKGNGFLRIQGNLDEPDLVGAVKVSDAKVTIDFTKCTYTLQDPTITFTPDKIDFGTIQLKDANGYSASFKGDLEHHFFNKFNYNLSATSRKLLVLNTNRNDNNLFYGKAVARFNFSITGPDESIKMYMSGAPVDSSSINILTSTNSKQSADVDFVVWKTYGTEMKSASVTSSSNFVIDMDLVANPFLRMNVVLDELTGDIISGQGSGNLKIHTGSKENFTMIGRYNIENGSYNFNFQDVFKKPFRLLGGGSSYISWTGDPYDADINIDALYTAEKVRMSTLFTDPSNRGISGVSSDVLREISDVEVRCNLTGTLSRPNPSFQILIPQGSVVKNNATIENKLKTINRDALEVSKQATYLIVFKSFAPQAAVVASDLNYELLNSTISGVINGILSNSVQNFFTKMLGSSVDVNFNYSRTMTTLGGTAGANRTGPNNFRENVSLQFIKTMMNDKLIITFGSDFNFAAGAASLAASSQNFLFLPDVNVEYKITPDGKFRTSFFYRSSFDLLSSSGKRDRTGGNISFRTEFDRFFERKKKTVVESDKNEP
jgi:TamB, inner membrane protein subunit of TAM complex